MGRFGQTLGLVLVALALLASPAEAKHWKVRGSFGTSARQIAANYWGVSQTCPASTVQIVWEDWAFTGQAPIGGCWNDERTIFLNDKNASIKPRYMCSIIVHEYGHLIGMEHSDDPRSVMHTPPPINMPGCAKARTL